MGKFEFRARNKWVSGTHNRATVKDFHGALKEDDSRQTMVFEEDEPPCGSAQIKAPTPWNTAHRAAEGVLLTCSRANCSNSCPLCHGAGKV